ncbi:glycerol-3-phosphate 1-O-acyltransferase PlsB [Thalassotalea sp. G2M2-11]|uniref:glycerol-3-phosphate 1-O-acyltransferase PlsB n=1 Tax=Thalassotalea sp. G2M2-11 TaxID=2787627 RepID=UPI0019D0D21F|nr:glycerol-3-phosphate 1-O-acyltransferase PlsB [Thalassotalea sp. G2M2-11]
MLAFRQFFYFLLNLPIKIWVNCRIVADNVLDNKQANNNKPIFYVVRNKSASDLLALKKACKKLHYPDPLEQVTIDGKRYDRTFCLEQPSRLFGSAGTTNQAAQLQGEAILTAHHINNALDAQLIPVNLIWGRKPTVERNKASIGTLLADQESPNWLRKFFIVLFLGRNTLVRFSDPLSFRFMADKHGTDDKIARKLLRVARFHFYRQKIAATGPRLMHRQQMFKTLMKNPSIKRLISEEVASKKITEEKAKKQALAIMDEIAGDYRESMIRVGERILHWLWNRLYSGIEVNNANTLRELADEGHEVIYVPCHRSHMDYLLLTYIIYQQGLVTPRIAAGINLNFWPAGPIFRKAGAFFIRRSFRGNRMYSTIFREYLGLLFERGYSVKYYSEGGRSRTGKLLEPKTGMLAMTIQSLLRGIKRPLTIVPVYLGYEHVMEVGTYHKELSGSKKQNESIFGVFKAIRNLRNYGKGYVNFGTPININQFLTEQVPDWKSAIDEVEPQKPTWLTPSVNVLADQVMVAINKCAALNSISLIALILHASENKALSRQELEAQLDFFLMMQRDAPYSDELTIPEQNGQQLLSHAISLNKVTVEQDSFGDIISLSDSAALEMRYYRNNVLHTYILPALICRILDRTAKINQQDIIEHVLTLMPLLKNDFFLWQNDEQLASATKQILSVLAEQQHAKQSKAGFWTLVDDHNSLNKIKLLGECVEETLLRLTIITTLIKRLSPIGKNEFSEKVVAIAKRLSVINNINAPEFIDKKAQMTLINAMREHGFIASDDDGKLMASSTIETLKPKVHNLVDIAVLQSILR